MSSGIVIELLILVIDLPVLVIDLPFCKSNFFLLLQYERIQVASRATANISVQYVKSLYLSLLLYGTYAISASEARYLQWHAKLPECANCALASWEFHLPKSVIHLPKSAIHLPKSVIQIQIQVNEMPESVIHASR